MSQQYANEESFKVFVDYLALKQHFTTKSYDYFKYNGKVSTKFDKFLTRNDTYYFNKLAVKPNYHEILLANIVKNPKTWIREIVDPEGYETYLAWKKNVDSLSYRFETDLKELKDDFKSNFIVKNGAYPFCLDLYIQKKISLETFSILLKLTKVKEYWDETISDKIYAKDVLDFASNYIPFLEIDDKNFSKIIKKSIEKI